MNRSSGMTNSLADMPVRVGTPGLPGELVVPLDAQALVLFVHGSGSSRLSPRNQWVAGILHRYRMATLLFDLLTESEGSDRRKVFDIDLLGQRVKQALDWVGGCKELTGLRIGLFGASTGAAAALVTAAERPGEVAAVVSRGGRPDLALDGLPQVQAPTLLIVGSEDCEVLELNRAAMRALRCCKRLEVVPGATHLFEESGALECVAELGAAWFDTHLTQGWKGRPQHDQPIW
ncbi:MAG: dienelactone hydrolase family protein [Pseudomonadota bacterium]|nr:dienelactone hydrolase family protein [Pseudomonadota bacterium]